MRACGAAHPPPVMNSASTSHSAGLDFDPDAPENFGWCRERRPPKADESGRGNLRHAKRCLVERDLLLATDLVGEFFPRRGDRVGAGLRVRPAGEDLGQFVLRDAVVLENAADAWLDRTVRMIIGAELRVQIRGNVFFVVTRRHPFVDVGMTGPVNLEAGRIHYGPEREILAAHMLCRAPT